MKDNKDTLVGGLLEKLVMTELSERKETQEKQENQAGEVSRVSKASQHRMVSMDRLEIVVILPQEKWENLD
jgi:hypothetical protein